MDRLHEFLNHVRNDRQAAANLLGLLHVLIGRRISLPNGDVVVSGLTWRESAAWLKKVRWPPESARQLGLDPADLPPRDRERFWYEVIKRAAVDSSKATQAGDRLKGVLVKTYLVGPAPGQ